MKLIFIISLFFSLHVAGQNSFYELNVETAYGGKFSMGQYKGLKVLVAAVNVNNLKKKAALQFWDSLKTANPKVAFILIPASDMDSTENDSTAMRDIKDKTPEKLVLSDAGKVKKDKGDKQNTIMQWLTDVGKNKHFDLEVESDVQIYVVSESGELYAVLTKDTKLAILNEVLNQADVEPPVFADMRP